MRPSLVIEPYQSPCLYHFFRSFIRSPCPPCPHAYKVKSSVFIHSFSIVHFTSIQSNNYCDIYLSFHVTAVFVYLSAEHFFFFIDHHSFILSDQVTLTTSIAIAIAVPLMTNVSFFLAFLLGVFLSSFFLVLFSLSLRWISCSAYTATQVLTHCYISTNNECILPYFPFLPSSIYELILFPLLSLFSPLAICIHCNINAAFESVLPLQRCSLEQGRCPSLERRSRSFFLSFIS